MLSLSLSLCRLIEYKEESVDGRDHSAEDGENLTRFLMHSFSSRTVKFIFTVEIRIRINFVANQEESPYPFSVRDIRFQSGGG